MNILKGSNTMIISSGQMAEIVQHWAHHRLDIVNKISGVNWSERERGFVVEFETIQERGV